MALLAFAVLSACTLAPSPPPSPTPSPPSPQMELLVGSCWHGGILRYDGKTGKFIDFLVKPGGELACAEGDGIIGPDGNLYVTNFNPGRIARYAKSRDSVLRYNPRTGKLIDVFIAPSPELD